MGWFDGYYGCDDYAQIPALCSLLGGIDYNGEGKAQTRCCSCGGGSRPCPTDCKSPSCLSGLAENGGLPLVNGTCQGYCSQELLNDKRYCGLSDHSAYTDGDSVDCSGCQVIADA